MKHTITKLEGPNEPIQFIQSILGNYFLETNFGNCTTKESPLESDTQSELLHCTWIDDDNWIIVYVNCHSNSNLYLETNIWTLFFLWF
jgi:hypothetical protein